MAGRGRPALLLLLLAACGNPGAQQFAGQTPPLDPVAVYGQCAFCHDGIATTLVATGGHSSLEIRCQACHDDLTPNQVGCGHESLPRCQGCHSAQLTHHDPAAGTPQQCTVCHTPHGSSNLQLIRTEVPLADPANMTLPCSSDGDCASDQVCASTNEECGAPTQTGGCAAPIVFTNLGGKADGSFASVSRPGTGVCEVCHTTTRFYRSNGTGEPHFGFPCYTCHPHTAAFAPQS